MMIFDDDFRERYEKVMMPSKCYKDVLNEDQLNQLVEFMFRKTASWRTSNTGNLFFSGNLDELGETYIIPWLKDIIGDTINFDEVYQIRGNFFHTPHQYGIHTDMPEYGNTNSVNIMPYRSILIPLYILPKKTLTHITFYDQRVLDYGCTLDYGPYKSTTHYRSFTDYSKIEHVYTLEGKTEISDTPISQEEYEKNFFHWAPSSIERYTGLSVENNFEWTPGNVYTFDTAQIHSSNCGEHPFKSKAGLRLSLMKFYRRDHELPES